MSEALDPNSWWVFPAFTPAEPVPLDYAETSPDGPSGTGEAPPWASPPAGDLTETPPPCCVG